jgi:hypothetical protein
MSVNGFETRRQIGLNVPMSVKITLTTYLERVNLMAKKMTVKFQVMVLDDEVTNFEYFLNDLLVTSIFPALSADLVPLSLEVKKGRN